MNPHVIFFIVILVLCVILSILVNIEDKKELTNAKDSKQTANEKRRYAYFIFCAFVVIVLVLLGPRILF